MAETKPLKPRATARRTERVYLQIPIEVRGEQSSGGPFSERTHTLIINRDGARISLVQPLCPGQNITITNLRTGVSCPFQVVGSAGKSIGEAPEWGVECLALETDFWGIHFPSLDEAQPEGEHVDALLECTACHARELAKLSLRDYRDLSLLGTLPRDCQRCGKESEWRFGYVQALDQSTMPWEEEGSPEEPLSQGGGEEKRRAKRLAIKLPVRIRLPDGREEVARTENLSRMGVCFVSDLEIQPDDLIHLTIGYVAGGKEGEVKARVVWRRAIEETNRFIYGVHLEEES
jgi:PilZ domain